MTNIISGQKTGGQYLVGGLDCTVHINFFGSQIQSFEAELLVPELVSKEGGPESFCGIFIHAPAILEAGPKVQVLADYPDSLEDQASQGSFAAHGCQNVLIAAIGQPEHPGYMRAAGAGVTIKKYFGPAPRTSSTSSSMAPEDLGQLPQ
ncbi:probable pyridoxal 5'-phosphate synthase subunit pdx2 [Glycine max]|uniref:probable pyridoxal 5'-phosphate synthase subunit pdx2 n=1 Tax=Glycine max TaxID=3847 RepID=UPI0003DE86AC|nr:probable pyridoxal 5'-phosphate synthase subunit pdx2 [Glycine max]|eukprot:XP_006574154.1 probable pyridoxal 5'-phosphate synthase subunit pdx2 [Glycine max]